VKISNLSFSRGVSFMSGLGEVGRVSIEFGVR